MTTWHVLIHPATLAQAIAAWLWLNVVPFSIVGLGLHAASHFLTEGSRRQQRAFAALVVALVLSTGCTTAFVAHREQVTYRQTHGAIVIYDYCKDPNIPYWLWLLDCLL